MNDFLINLFSVNGHILWSFNTKTYLVALYAKHHNAHIITNPQDFT